MIRTIFTFLTLSLSLVPLSWGQSQLEETRKVFQELVAARQEIANKRASWMVRKQAFLDAIELAKLEIDLLQKRIEATEEQSTQAERDRIRLNGEIEELKEASAVVAGIVRDLEQRVLGLVNALPLDIKENLNRLTRRIPGRNVPDSRVRASLGERMQNIVGLLNSIEVFNNGIQVLTEVREIGGQNVSVEVFYIGLAKAYYVNQDKGVAGYGVVSKESGWTWKEDTTLIDPIARMIRVYKNEIPAEFVVLPAEI